MPSDTSFQLLEVVPSRMENSPAVARRGCQQYRFGRRSGTGKTHIAAAIGIHAIEHHHKRVRFFSTAELVNALEQEKMQGRAGQNAGRLAYADLVILDELGYLPFSASGGALLFHVLSRLCEHTSVIITMKLSFSEWASVFGDSRMTTARSIGSPITATFSKRETTASASKTAWRTRH